MKWAFILVAKLWTMIRLRKGPFRRECLAYPQSWDLIVRIKGHSKWLARLLQWSCGKLTGHEVSKTEFGYDGSGMADYWCRWCNHKIRMPLREETDPLNLHVASWMDDPDNIELL